MSRSGHIAMVAGGTGGHVFPALAVADAFREKGYSVSWIGTERGIESRLVPAAGIDLHLVKVKGLRGSGWRNRIGAPFQLIGALLTCMGILRRLKPDLMMGFGGFVAGPAGLAARFCRVPLVIHEQNAVPGTTNRLLAKSADKVLTGFPAVLPHGVHVGNPVRKQFATKATPAAHKDSSLHLLILGGSQGALALNQTLPALLAEFCQQDLKIRHQCGERWVQETTQAYVSAGAQAQVMAFIDDMPAAYQWADVVICRAGAMTVAEIAAAGKPALFVPFPYAIDDHQTANARWLVDAGAALMVAEADLCSEFGSLIPQLLDSDQLATMAARSSSVAKLDATAQIVAACEEVLHVH